MSEDGAAESESARLSGISLRQGFSEDDPRRGPQFDAASCDEIGAWTHDEKTWMNLMFGLRLGVSRVAATTTPRPRELVRRLDRLARTARGGVVTTRASTRENALNLAPGFVEAMEESYRGKRPGARRWTASWWRTGRAGSSCGA